jgi:hypothetical protein
VNQPQRNLFHCVHCGKKRAAREVKLGEDGKTVIVTCLECECETKFEQTKSGKLRPKI